MIGAAIAVATWERQPSPQAFAPAPAPIDDHCAVRLEGEAPELPPPPVLTAAESRLAVTAELPTQWLAKQIGKRVPTTLASAKRRDVGTPGEVSYVVTRGAFSFDLDGDHLWVRTPVGATAEICKPIGPICPTYGSCAPRFGAGVRVPLMLDALDDGARVALQTYEGCSIAGIDATPRIEAQAQQQIGGVKARVDAMIPDPERRAELLALLSEPRPFADRCLRIAPRRLVQGPPALDTALRLSFAIEGTAVLGDCDHEAAPSAIERGEVEGESALVIASSWPWPSLHESLRPVIAGEAVRLEGISGAVVGGESVVVLALVLDGRACGPLWLAARPEVTAGELTLRDVRALAPASPPDDVTQTTVEAIESARIALPPEVARITAELSRLEKILAEGMQALPPDLELEARLTGQEPRAVAEVDASGLRLLARRNFRLVIAPKAPATP